MDCLGLLVIDPEQFAYAYREIFFLSVTVFSEGLRNAK
jgi:hypothetical protein